jgi:hypothetical protein
MFVFLFMSVLALTGMLVQQPYQSALLLAFIYPPFTKLMLFLQKRCLLRSAIFICPLMVSLHLMPLFTILKNQDLGQLIYLSTSKVFAVLCGQFLMEWFLDYLAGKVLKKKEESQLVRWLYAYFEEEINHIATDSQYEKALGCSIIIVSMVTSIFLEPALALLILLSEEYSKLPAMMQITQPSILVPTLFFFINTPVFIYAIFILVDLLKRYWGLRIEEAMRFNHFKFMREKFRWMSDVFAQSKDIRQEFREYEKFAFSSQLYFVISLMAIGMQVALLGIMTMLQMRYLPFYDPVTMCLFAIIWLIVEILSTAVSFASVKLRLYERKQSDPIRLNLNKIDKYLKVDERTAYL